MGGGLADLIRPRPFFFFEYSKKIKDSHLFSSLSLTTPTTPTPFHIFP
jgi:hypothetical protein